MKLLALALVLLFAFGDVAGPSDLSLFGSYNLDWSAS